jgi:hypothetical protein
LGSNVAMKIKIENSGGDADLAFVLDQYAQLLKEKNIDFELERRSSGTKDVGVITTIVLWAASNAAWDLLKLAVGRLNRQFRNPAKVTVDGKDYELSNLPAKAPSAPSDTSKD